MAIRSRLRRRPFFTQEEPASAESWKDITDVNFSFDTKQVTLTDVNSTKYTVSGIEKVENYAGSEYEVVTIKPSETSGNPGAFMMLLRPSTVRRLDPITLSIRG